MASLGVATLGSEFDSAGLKNGLNRALGQTQGFMKSFRRIWETAIGFIVANVIMRLVAAIRDVGREVFNAAARFQALQIQLEGLTAREIFRLSDGTISFKNALIEAVEPAKELVDWVKRISVTTPFTVESLQNTLSTAMAMGFATEQAKRLTVAAGNFTAGMGLSNEVLQRIIYNFGQMKASGKIMGTELRDLARGALVPVNDVFAEMQKNLGKTSMSLEDFKEDMKDSREGVDLFISTFVEMVERDFGNAAERMSRTWQGITSNIQDFIQANLGAGIVLPTLDRISESLAGLLDELLRPDVQESMDYLGRAIAGFFEIDLDPTALVDKLAEGMNELAVTLELFDAFGDVGQLLERLGFSQQTIDIVFAIGDALQWLKENWNEVKIALLAIAAPSILAGIVGVVAGIVAALASPIAIITLIIAAISFLYFAWQENWFGMRDTILEWWDVVKDIWTNFMAQIQQVGAFLTSIFGFLAPTFQELGNAIRTSILVLGQAMEPIKGQLMDLWIAFQPVAIFLGKTLLVILGIVATFIVATVLTVIGAIVGLINGLAQGITAFLGHIQAMADNLHKMWSSLITAWTGFWNLIVGIFTGNSTLLKQGFSQLRTGILGILTGLLETTKTNFIATFDFVLGLVSGFVEGFLGFFENLYNTLVGNSIVPDIMNGIMNVFSGGFPQLMTVIQTGITMFQTVFETFLQLLANPAQFFITLISQMFMSAQMIMTQFVMTVSMMWKLLFTQMSNAVLNFSTGALDHVRKQLSLLNNQLINVIRRGRLTKEFILGELAPAFITLERAISSVASAINRVQRALNKLSVPSLFMPGSPTPFEMGLRGILSAMNEMADTALPSMQSSLSGLRALDSLAAAGATTNYNNSFEFRDTTLDEEQLRSLQRRQEILSNG